MVATGAGARVGVILATAFLTVALATTYGLAARQGRGYLPAVSALFVTLFLAQVPLYQSGTAPGFRGPYRRCSPGSRPRPGRDRPRWHLSVALVGLAASAATVVWWQRADHDR